MEFLRPSADIVRAEVPMEMIIFNNPKRSQEGEKDASNQNKHS